MTSRKCGNGCKDSYGNCYVLGSDGLPVQCVGPWVEKKFYFLERYLNASCEARRKFADKGNAVYIDLFAGSGRCIIRKEQKEIDSGGLRALNRDEAPFNELHYIDIATVNTDALAKRTRNNASCYIRSGDSNVLIFDLVQKLLLTPYRYHFAFIDPFGPEALKFGTISELAKLQRMDMLIHFPIGAIKRNLSGWMNRENTILDDFLGTSRWREKLDANTTRVSQVMIEIYTEQLNELGFKGEELRVVPVKNTKQVYLYALILVSRNPLGRKLWNSVLKYEPNGQKNLL